MSFDCSLPFVKSVYRHVEAGELEVCIQFLEEFLVTQATTPMHWLIGKSFLPRMPDFSEWLYGSCERIKAEQTGFAIGTSMGEHEINFNNWQAEILFCPNYDDSIPLAKWLQQRRDGIRGLNDGFPIHGLDPLRTAFVNHNYGDPPLDGILISSEVFTAVSFLMHVRYLEMVRTVHQQAAERNHRLATVPIFSYYGDLYWLSLPTVGREPAPAATG